mmetsp:Transcript_69657/g.109944  ORF Transcript_69657/g.109944 Transcript_69657/m.109944 type:complete len:226 (-) Transcript_69657:310-987(-)
MADLGKCKRRACHTEQVEGEVRGDCNEGVLESVAAVFHDLCHRVLHPVEEERVSCFDVIRSLSLLDGQPKEGPLVFAHQAQPRTSFWIVILSTAKIRGSPAAAVDANRPKVIGCQGLLAKDNRCHAIPVEVPKRHGLRGVQPSSIFEIDAARIHQLLTFLPAGVHGRVGVDVLNVVVRLHVVPIVHITKDRGKDGRKAGSQESKGVPGGVPIAHLGAISQNACQS